MKTDNQPNRLQDVPEVVRSRKHVLDEAEFAADQLPEIAEVSNVQSKNLLFLPIANPYKEAAPTPAPVPAEQSAAETGARRLVENALREAA